MKLIDIEGLDGCGKATQSKLLKQYYESKGEIATILEFPSSSLTGNICTLFQQGHFGDPIKKDPIFSSLLYTMNRATTFQEPNEFDRLSENDYVICDRYKMSNLICHLHKLKTDKEKFEYIEFMKRAESTIPQEDITIILTVPLEISVKLIEERAKDTKDLNESIEAQSIFRNNLFWMMLRMNHIQDIWSDKKGYRIEMIDCSDTNGVLLSPEEIHQKIIRKIIQI